MPNFNQSESFRGALVSMLSNTRAWSGALPELIAALAEYTSEEDRIWHAALTPNEMVALADEADLARDRVRLWYSGETFFVVRDEAVPFDASDESASLGVRTAKFWRFKHVELFGERGSQASAEHELAVQYARAISATVEPGACRFCGLPTNPTANLHSQCANGMRRQDEAWIVCFLDLVRQRPEAVPVAWPSAPPLPLEARPSATPTPGGYMDRIRLFVDECCELNPSFEVDRPSIIEAWATWCDARRVRRGDRTEFHIGLQLAVPSVTTPRKETWSGRTVYRGIKLRESELEPDIDIDAATTDAPESVAALVGLFLNAEMEIAATAKIGVSDLHNAFLRWGKPRNVAAVPRDQFIAATTHLVPAAVLLRKPRGLVIEGVTLKAGAVA